MMARVGAVFGLVAFAGAVAMLSPAVAPLAAEEGVRVPAPTLDPADSRPSATAILSGGCFWGVEGVFSHVRGVTSVVSGYQGGSARDALYDRVGSGTTGHAESVRITYDPRVVSYGSLLRVFFSVVIDPTTRNRQGPDVGTQYRSAIVPLDADQARVARAYVTQLGAGHYWSRPIVTRIEANRGFYPAEAYHQDFMALHPDQGYIRAWDAPKLANLRSLYPRLYTPTAAP